MITPLKGAMTASSKPTRKLGANDGPLSAMQRDIAELRDLPQGHHSAQQDEPRSAKGQESVRVSRANAADFIVSWR